MPASWSGKKVLVHFEGVGGITTIYGNGQKLGTNTGAWNRVSFELPAEAGESCELVVRFDDREPRLPRGKPDKFSGIWQTVWLEPVPDAYIRGFHQTPDIDEGNLTLDRTDLSDQSDRSDLSLTATAYDGGTEVATTQAPAGASLLLKIPAAKLWSPDDPFLYDLKLELKKGDEVLDSVTSYFGMRKIEWREVDCLPRILLNNEVIYQAGLLDQGQWPESFFTPPSDEALKWEIEQAKAMGFNVLRKHIKVEASRWYYWCDVLGMLVWQDLPCQILYTKKAHETEEDKQFMRDDMHRMIDQLYNHPSIICWVIFNEAWGQFEPRDMTIRARKLDQSRLINATSHVWPNDFNRKRYNVDMFDVHDYQREIGFEHTWDYSGSPHLPHVIGEFGGIGYLIPENTEKHDEYSSYGPDAQSPEELLSMYKDLVIQSCKLRESHDLCAIIYTEITDWIREINGWITYDRKVVKVDAEKLRQINELFLK